MNVAGFKPASLDGFYIVRPYTVQTLYVSEKKYFFPKCRTLL